jgi:hypothetical protein
MEDHVNSRHDLGTDSGITNVASRKSIWSITASDCSGSRWTGCQRREPLAFTEQPSDEVRSDETGATGHRMPLRVIPSGLKGPDASVSLTILREGGVTPAEKLIPQRLRGRHGRVAVPPNGIACHRKRVVIYHPYCDGGEGCGAREGLPGRPRWTSWGPGRAVGAFAPSAGNNARIQVEFLPMNPRLPGPLRLLQRIKFVRTVVTSFAYWLLLLRHARRFDVIHAFSPSYWAFLLGPVPAMAAARFFRRGPPQLSQWRS